MRLPIEIDPDIRRAHGLPSEVYHSEEAWALQVEGVFPRTWQLVGAAESVRDPGRAVPFTLLEGALDEPLLAVRDTEGRVRVAGRRFFTPALQLRHDLLEGE